ncbi:MAG: hypothetical protein V7L01_26995 [Nostoc sp.]|uniref:hypothetical protein n=1 Tax=Nostoc sp. TaxID=1180 RepID=UPI002FF54FD0
MVHSSYGYVRRKVHLSVRPTADLLERLMKMATVVIRLTTDKSQLSVPITFTLVDLFLR